MKALKDLYDLLTSIPFLGIIINIFSGGFGFIVPIAFVLQVALQITCASLWLGLAPLPLAAVAFCLCCVHLFIGFLIALQPLSGMGPKPTYSNEWEFVKLAEGISLVLGGICTSVVVGLAAVISGAGFWAFVCTAALSTVGGLLLHMFGVVIPIVRASRK